MEAPSPAPRRISIAAAVVGSIALSPANPQKMMMIRLLRCCQRDGQRSVQSMVGGWVAAAAAATAWLCWLVGQTRHVVRHR